MNNSCRIDEIKNSISNKTGILISAGPSLNKTDFTLLKKLSKKVILVAVDSALSVLLKRGLKPHFVIAVDCQYINYKHFLYNDLDSIIGVFESGVDPHIAALFPRKIFFHCGSGFCEETGKIPFLRVGGSVATVGYSFLKQLGMAKIILLGQDLALVNTGLSHCFGSYHEKYALQRNGRFLTAVWRHLNIHAGNTLQEKDFNNREVLSTEILIKFRDWFLWEFERDKNVSITNCSEAGILFGKNITSTSLEKAAANIAKDVQIDIDMNDIDFCKRIFPDNFLNNFWLAKKEMFTKALAKIELIKNVLDVNVPSTNECTRSLEYINNSRVLNIFGKLLEPYAPLIKEPFSGRTDGLSTEKRKKYMFFFENLGSMIKLCLNSIDKIGKG